jgi:hypothetical protein
MTGGWEPLRAAVQRAVALDGGDDGAAEPAAKRARAHPAHPSSPDRPPAPDCATHAGQGDRGARPPVLHAWHEPVEHSLLLPRCRLVLHHGGSGTTAAALAVGLPQARARPRSRRAGHAIWPVPCTARTAQMPPRCSALQARESVRARACGAVRAVASAPSPQVCVPCFMDQPQWAERLEDLGVAPPALPRALVFGAARAAGEAR